MSSGQILLIAMWRRLLIAGILLTIAAGTLGWRVTGSERGEPEMATLTVLVPVSQIHGELVTAALGGQPFLDCDELITVFGLYVYSGPPTGVLPCHLDVEITP